VQDPIVITLLESPSSDDIDYGTHTTPTSHTFHTYLKTNIVVRHLTAVRKCLEF